MNDPSGSLRRHATLLFADLCDYTALNELTDPEEVDLILSRIKTEIEAVVQKHGGTANEWYGDGVLCVFGLPQATEEDARHAVEAGLEMHEVVRGLERELPVPAGFEIRLHSGIASGLVFARERVGARGYELIGDSVNTAARLCACAGRDELWVTDASLGGFKDFFDTEAVAPLSLKGKKESVPACRIVARSNVLTRFAASQRRGLTPLVGRDEALARLKQGFSRALESRVELMSVVGSPGVGKTRIVEEFKRRLPEGIGVFTGQCENESNATPLRPFTDVVRQVFGLQAETFRDELVRTLAVGLERLSPALSKHQPALLHLLGAAPLPSAPASPDSPQQGLVDVLGDVLVACSRKQPLVLVLDDWQWADDASRQVLGQSLRLLRDAPAFVVLACRDLGDPLLSGHEVVELAPFTSEQSATVIAALLPYSIDLGVRRGLHERSGGNPLFLEEICRALPADAPSGEEDLVKGRVPTTLRGIIQVRAERLSEIPARVLHAAAVIGNEIPYWLLDEVSSTPDLARTLAVLVESDLIHQTADERTLRFKHGTTRDVVYDSVRLPDRRRLHLAAAQALERHCVAAALPEPYEALAYHYAGASEHEQAARFAELAGDRAAATSSLDRARQQYRSALDALETLGFDPERERRWVAIVEKWAAASLYNPAEEHLRLIAKSGERAARVSDAAGVTRAENWLGWFHYALGDQKPAISHWKQALEKAQTLRDDRLVAQLFLNLGQSLAAAGDYTDALRHLDAGLDAKRETRRLRRNPTNENRVPLGFAYALACKGLLHGDVGEFEKAYACFDEALRALEGTGQAVEGSCLGLLGMVELMQGRWEDSLKTALRAQATAERVNGPYVFAMSKTVSGYARWMLKRDRDALSELEHAVTWMETRGIRLYLSFNYGYLADALATAGQIERALDYANRALSRAASTDPLGEAMACRTLARLPKAASGGDARHYLERALQSARARNSEREIRVTELEIFRLRRSGGLEFPGGPSARDLGTAFHTLGMEFFEREAAALLD